MLHVLVNFDFGDATPEPLSPIPELEIPLSCELILRSSFHQEVFKGFTHVHEDSAP